MIVVKCSKCLVAIVVVAINDVPSPLSVDSSSCYVLIYHFVRGILTTSECASFPTDHAVVSHAITGVALFVVVGFDVGFVCHGFVPRVVLVLLQCLDNRSVRFGSQPLEINNQSVSIAQLYCLGAVHNTS